MVKQSLNITNNLLHAGFFALPLIRLGDDDSHRQRARSYLQDAWGYDTGGWQCEGDALPAWASSSFFRAHNTWGSWRLHANWDDCDHLQSRILVEKEYGICPLNCNCCLIPGTCNAFCGASTCYCSVFCDTHLERSWCEEGFPDLGQFQDLSEFADPSQDYLRVDERQQAKATRTAVMQSYNDAAPGAYDICM